MEVAADEKVLDVLESSEQKRYGKALLAVLERFNSPRLASRLIGMIDDRKNIERRIRMIRMAELFKSKRRLFILTGILYIAILSGVLLTNPLTKQASFVIGNYILKVPADWKVTVGEAELIFERNNIPFGGVEIVGYEPNQSLFLPNHSETKWQKDIEGLITKAVLVNLDLTQPAASGDTSIKNENHLYLLFANEKIAYDIYANTKYVNESQLIRIAKSFIRINNKETKGYNADVLLRFKNKYVGDHVNVVNLIDNLPYADLRREVLLQTKNAPYGITVKYDFSAAGTDAVQSEITLRNNAVIMFALIDNVDIINFNLKTDEEEKNYQYTRAQIQQSFDKDLREYAKDIRKFETLLNSFSQFQSRNPKSIDEAVSIAIKNRGENGYLDGEVATEGHLILDTEEKNGNIKVYTISSFGYFGFENGIFTKISGSGAIPTVITFSKNEKGEYSLLEYKEPVDGVGYIDSVKKMFPSKLWDKVLSEGKNYPELVKQLEAQAGEYLKSIGRNAKVSVAYVEKKPVNIGVEASNKLFAEFTKYDAFLNSCPYWIGTREIIENGVRYIYETSQSKTSDGYDIISFKKKKEDGTVVKEHKYKIIGNEPQLISK
ncbi:MAG: bla regulator protein blaR1 [Thermoanaerobacteraceae bacterium]|nr:bla regulator protein blaR1 [Thermoanaerobacteraceae bacterium]